MEISTTNSSEGTRKRIALIDIEAIEPMQGIKFKLVYHAKPNMYSKLIKKDKTLKTEYYTSRHLA